MADTGIAERLNEIQSFLANYHHPVLLAVSKYASLEQIIAAYRCGQRDFGESKVQVLAEKEEALAAYPDIRWHFIGHLQTNKINQFLKINRVVSIKAVDSWHLAAELYQKMQALPEHSALNFFWQINPNDQDQKYGLKSYAALKEVMVAWQKLTPLANFKNVGLMVMSSLTTVEAQKDFAAAAEQTFFQTKIWAMQLAQELNLPRLKLSMGMSQDFKIAAEVGTDEVRLGSCIFAE